MHKHYFVVALIIASAFCAYRVVTKETLPATTKHTVTVRTLDGDEIKVKNVTAGTRIEDLKNTIEAELTKIGRAIKAEAMRLVAGTKELFDDHVLEDHELRREMTVVDTNPMSRR